MDDQTVALEPLQRGVHLPHVQGPDLTGAGLELLAQLEPVPGALGQQGEQGVTDAHRSFRGSSILRRILGILMRSIAGSLAVPGSAP